MRKNLGLRFDKESEGYLLSPSLHTALFLTPVWEEIPDTINIEKGLPSDWPTTYEILYLWGV